MPGVRTCLFTGGWGARVGLVQVRLLQPLTNQARALLGDVVTLRQFDRGERIVNEGDSADHFYIILVRHLQDSLGVLGLCGSFDQGTQACGGLALHSMYNVLCTHTRRTFSHSACEPCLVYLEMQERGTAALGKLRTRSRTIEHFPCLCSPYNFVVQHLSN